MLSDGHKGWRHIEADMYHTSDDGTCNWRPENVKAAHRWCQDTARELLSDGFNVVVSNTFTQMWEMEPYVKMAQELNETLYVVKMATQYQNSHNVPSDVIERMKKRWED
jgi:predicted kinase